MNRRQFLKAAGCGLLSLGCSPMVIKSQSAKPPNIIIVLADDMGFSDAGCYGGEIHTPNIDRLAENGLRFRRFFNCARCCPTRASLLTGQYAHKVGLAKNGRSLSSNGLTIAEALKGAGYETAMVGKWHLSRTDVLPDSALHQKWLDHQHDPMQPFAPIDTYPVSRGFDRHYGVIWGVIDFFDPFSLVEGTRTIDSVPDDYYFTDAVGQKAVEYVQDMSKSKKPFFLYLAHCAPHWPLHARPEDIDKYKDTYKDGWNQLRKNRFARQLKMGLFKQDNTPLPPVQEQGKGWDELSDRQKQYEARKMAVHAAMIDRLDQGFGMLLKTLEDLGQLDNTVIFFLSDNGASPETPTAPGYDRTGHTRDGRRLHYGDCPIELLGSELSYTGIGPAWASVANTPFRYWKMESFEGGCHTPLVVHWPDGLKASAGSFTDEMSHVIDIMPTCLDLAGISYPKQYEGNQLTDLDGKSLADVLQGRNRNGHERLFFEHVNGRAVRTDDWKLVALTRTPQTWELYNVSEDQTETNNLAAKHPDRVDEMSRAWDAWIKSVNPGND